MIIDSHCHYNLDPLLANWHQHWEKAQAMGVSHSMVVSADLASSKKAVELAAQNSDFKAALGIHPDIYQTAIETGATLETGINLIEDHIAALKQLHRPKLVTAIGETGLDYFRLPETNQGPIKQLQKAAFIAHMQLASDLQLPLIIHVRDRGEAAYRDVLTILQERLDNDQKFILHCVSGPTDYIKAALNLGAYVGMAGNITYKNSEHLRDLVRMAPPHQLLLETDAPFLPPQEFRGQVCEPWMISQTAQFVADELNLDLEQLYHNAHDLLGF